MPKNTFINLVEAKREYILQACLEEFSDHNYDTASVSKIVEKLNIAKGSIYQYFIDKRDLYFFLIETACKFKIIYIIKNVKYTNKNFYELVKAMMIFSLKFDEEYRDYGNLLSRVYMGNNDSFGTDTQNFIRNLGEDYFLELVKHAQEKGEISKEFKPSLIFHIICQMITNIIRFEDENRNKKDCIEEIVEVLKYGLRGRCSRDEV